MTTIDNLNRKLDRIAQGFRGLANAAETAADAFRTIADALGDSEESLQTPQKPQYPEVLASESSAV